MKKIKNTNKTSAENMNVDSPLIAASGSSANTGVANDSISSTVISAYLVIRKPFVALPIFSSAIKAIGMILLGFGIVQIGLSLKSHDASQRANGFLTFFGGVIIAFAKDILDLIL